MHCYWLQLQGALLVTSSTPRTIYMRPQCMSPMTLSCTYVCSRLVHAVQEKEVMQTKRSAADLSAIQADGKSRSVRMLAAYLDLGARYKMVGKQQRASAELRGLRIETRVTLGEEKVQPPHFSLCHKATL